ncbi:MAG: DUF736 domain-containing protein [Bacteroidales bacterium]|nr:DUF736 domain-containing protein [Bacteroidales bacterium]
MKKTKSLLDLLREQKRETFKKSIENNEKNGQKTFTKDQKVGFCYAQYHKNGISYIINLNDLEISLIAYEDFFQKRNNAPSFKIKKDDTKEEIGAGWEKVSKNGNKYYFIIINNEKYLMFENLYKKNKDDYDFTIFKTN